MILIGRYNELEIARIVSVGAYLASDDGEEVLLPRKYLPADARAGSLVPVFVYTDSEDRPVATTQRPAATVGEFAVLACKQTVPFGSFLDWGLEKDLFVPAREQLQPMVAGERYPVRVCFDARNKRVYATSKIAKFLKGADDGIAEGAAADFLFYDEGDLGWSVAINGTYDGLVYRDEVYEPVAVGERRKGWIKKVREDGKIDCALRQPGFGGVIDSRDAIVAALRAAGGFLPVGDHTDPAEITRIFSMSKKTYKRAAGTLYKERTISIDDDGIRLLRDPAGAGEQPAAGNTDVHGGTARPGSGHRAGATRAGTPATGRPARRPPRER